ncbi:MAG: DUF4292 domain-containing protein [Bacteroidales bacterium]|jgi:hypothetical protein|nr:DUF4292 domain-containing protein [Bacteroidales bacterium]
MKNNKKRNADLLFVCLFLLSITACTTKKIVSKKPVDATTSVSVNAATETTKPQIASLNYQWISYRVDLSLIDVKSKKETVSGSAFFVNRKDSIIYVAVSKFGIEGMRAVITPDTVKYLNHLNSTCYVGDYSLLKKMLGINVNFYFLQAVLLGEDMPGFSSECLFSVSGDTNLYSFPSRENKEMKLLVSQELKTNAAHKIIENNLTELSTQTFLGIRYGNFTALDTQSFFQQAEWLIPSENILLTMGIKDIKLNVPGPTSIRIPAKYKLIELK